MKKIIKNIVLISLFLLLAGCNVYIKAPAPKKYSKGAWIINQRLADQVYIRQPFQFDKKGTATSTFKLPYNVSRKKLAIQVIIPPLARFQAQYQGCIQMDIDLKLTYNNKTETINRPKINSKMTGIIDLNIPKNIIDELPKNKDIKYEFTWKNAEYISYNKKAKLIFCSQDGTYIDYSDKINEAKGTNPALWDATLFVLEKIK